MSLFDSKGSNLSVYNGKMLSVLGDSISTFAGYVPSGNAVYYSGSTSGVGSVEDMWWKKLLDATGMRLCVNESWSGSRVSGSDSSAGCMARCTKLHSGDSVPDVIIVYLGINDFNNGVALGEYDGTRSFPTETSQFREAYSVMLNKIVSTYPSAEVWVSTLPYCERTGENVFPEKNGNGELLASWNGAICELADLFGVKVMEFAKCGLRYQNMELYMGDYASGEGLHPNAAGHSLLANQAIGQLDPLVRKRYV